jgi:hypothetical protein
MCAYQKCMMKFAITHKPLRNMHLFFKKNDASHHGYKNMVIIKAINYDLL